jgi:hypothetical protein
MTNQHRATPDDWAQQEDWANRSVFSGSSCIIELRDRLEALESAQHTHVEAKAAEAGARCAVEQIRSKPGSWQSLKVDTEITYGDAHAAAKQILRAPMVVEGTFKHVGETYRFKAKPERETAMDEAQPAGSLVEWVADAIQHADGDGIAPAWEPEARAAILAVAAALIDWWNSHEDAPMAWEAAKWLEQEANR